MRLPRAEVLAASLFGRPVRTYLGREARIVAIENDAVVVADGRGDAGVRVPLADVQAGLDQLDAEGEVPVTIDALGPWAKCVGSMLVEVEGAAYGDAPARVVWAGRSRADPRTLYAFYTYCTVTVIPGIPRPSDSRKHRQGGIC